VGLTRSRCKTIALRGQQNQPGAEELDAGAAVHLALDGFQAVDLVCLPKSPFSLRALMLRPTADTLLGDDVGAPRTPNGL
jgi:hypothetical protein